MTTASSARTVVALAALAGAGLVTLPSNASAGGCGVCGAAHNIAVMQVGMGAAVVGGMALGALAASQAPAPAYGYAYGECYVAHRRAMDDYGNLYVRRVRVCQ